MRGVFSVLSRPHRKGSTLAHVTEPELFAGGQVLRHGGDGLDTYRSEGAYRGGQDQCGRSGGDPGE